MKINRLKINGFGKLKDKEFILGKNINIVYGKNESGKSTFQKFIPGILYGLSKNKNGKEISDLDKLEPWNSDEFSGKMEYELDNGKSYEVFREFNKKNPIIYNEKKEDISNQFIMDKNRGIQFFEEQTGIEETMFCDTSISEQQNVKLTKSSQNNIIQKITNLVSSGNENISYKKSIDKIIKSQIDRIGTERTTQKPLNIIENKISILEKQKSDLENLSSLQLNNEKEIIELKSNLSKDEEKINLLKEMKKYESNNLLKGAELNFNKNLEEEYNEKIEELRNEISIKSKQNIKKQRKNYKIQIFFSILFIVLAGLAVYFKRNFIYCFLIIPSIFILIWILLDSTKRKKIVKQKVKEIEELNNKINEEIEILEKRKTEKSIEAERQNEILNLEIKRNSDKIKNMYYGIVELSFIENVLAMDYEDIVSCMEILEERISNNKYKLHTLELDYENIGKGLENLNLIIEELENYKKEREELISLNKSFDLAKVCLKEAYEEAKLQITPKFKQNLCEIVKHISNDKYENINFDDQTGLTVELNNGKYIKADNLSIGTIDQLYLSLRLSALKEVTSENMPIILDESFAYFDNNRLESFLEYLNEKFSNNQIIIFTCTNREKEILEKKNISYNYIQL